MNLNALDVLELGSTAAMVGKSETNAQERLSFLNSDPSHKNTQKINRSAQEAYDPQKQLTIDINFVEGIKVISVHSEGGLLINTIPSDQAAEHYLTMQKKMSSLLSASPAASLG